MTRRRSYRAGSASIELAAGVFVFVVLLIMIIQGGAIMLAQVTATNAAREGARAAVTNPPADPYAAVVQASQGFERQINVQRSGDSVTVAVQLRPPILFSMVADWDFWLRGRTTMRVER